jgi:hypothetical protein
VCPDLFKGKTATLICSDAADQKSLSAQALAGNGEIEGRSAKMFMSINLIPEYFAETEYAHGG